VVTRGKRYPEFLLPGVRLALAVPAWLTMATLVRRDNALHHPCPGLTTRRTVHTMIVHCNNIDTMSAISPIENPETGTFKAMDDAQAQAWTLLGEVTERLRAVPHAPPAKGWLARVRKRLGNDADPVVGVYLWGGVGRGKTHIMDAFFEAAPFPQKRRMHFHHFMHGVHEELARLPPQPDPLVVLADKLATHVRLLCLDEFVVTDITDAMILHGLLRAFFERGITLVTTSNTPPERLYENGLQRDRFLPAIELLQSRTRVFNLDAGTDYRLRALQQAAVFFYPLDSNAEAGMETHFSNMSGGHAEATAALVINHRDIPVRKLAPGIAWFDFSHLCEGPRSTSDYIEIAREHHTVLLSGVPRLTPALDAAARRFLHLVDEFYDRNIKLIVSAEVPLQELYDGSVLAFEYERLRSRMTEMQSLDYLARPHLPV